MWLSASVERPRSIRKESKSSWTSGAASSRPDRRDARECAAVCHDCVWWQSRKKTGTTTGRCSARSSTARHISSPVRRSSRPGRHRATRCSSRVFMSFRTRPRGSSSRCSSPRLRRRREKGARPLEAFAYRYPEGESTYRRFLVHRTIFPRDFLTDFGFQPVRAESRVEIMRLDVGGVQRSSTASARPC
jgi:hypothetical protein